MKKFVSLVLVLIFTLSLVSFLPLSMDKMSHNVAKASDVGTTILHPTGCIPSPVKNWPKIDTEKLQEDLISKGITALPASVDWSAKEPPIGSQVPLNSCTAWATGYYYKTFQEGKEHNWDVGYSFHQFSPDFIYNQLNVGKDNGISIQSALQLLVDKGCDTLNVFPHNATDYTTQPTSLQLQLAIPFKALSYKNIFQGQGITDATIDILKQWLANGDTFVVAIPVYSEFDAASSSDPVFHDPSYVVSPHPPEDKPRGLHALQVVGYDDSLYYTNYYGKQYGAFKIVNSWGSDFGYGGYINLSYDFFKLDVLEAWTMTDAPSPSISIVHPSSGEVWALGTTRNIVWEESNTSIGDIQIFYKTSSNGIWNYIATLATQPNTSRQYSWNVQGLASTDCYITVINELGGYYIESDDSNRFTITSASQPDFSIFVSPNYQTVAPGGSINYNVTVTAQGGFNSSVSLSASGLPTDANANFTPASFIPSSTGTNSTLTISTATTSTKPSPPMNLTAVGGDGRVNLSWDTPLSDGGSTITQYNIYKGTSLGGETLWGYVLYGVNNCYDPYVTNGVTYYYYVKALNSVGESDPSNETYATPIHLTKPSPPQNLDAQVIYDSSSRDAGVKLTWSPPISDGGSSLTKYVIYRKIEGGSYYSIGEWSAAYACVWKDWDAKIGKTYYYKVTAVNSVGESDPSNEKSILVGVLVQTTATVNVRSGPGTSYSISTTLPSGVYGLALGGPTYADGYYWWYCFWGSPYSVYGWSVENYLWFYSGPSSINPEPVLESFLGAGKENLIYDSGGEKDNITNIYELSKPLEEMTQVNLFFDGHDKEENQFINGKVGFLLSPTLVYVPASTPVGTYTITITATGGGQTHSVQVTLNVASSSDFSISASPPSQSVTQGGSTAYTINLTSQNGFNSSVTLSASVLPSGPSCSFSPNPITPTASSTMTVSTSASTPVGTYTITITATGGGKTHSSQVTFSVGSSIIVPTVLSLSANTGGSSVTLNGQITNDGGSSITYRAFSYGKNSNESDRQFVYNVTVNGNYLSYCLNSLEPGTTYYFRAWAENCVGWGEGSLLQFTTSTPVLDHFEFNIIINQITGTPFNITITAKDQYGATYTSFNSAATLSVNKGSITPTTTTNFINGVLSNFSVTIPDANIGVTITATYSGKTGTSNSFDVANNDADTGGMQYANWYFNQNNLKEVNIIININNDPVTNDGIYFQAYDGYINGQMFYFGLQTRTGKPGVGLTGKGLIFSEFGTTDSLNIRVAPGGWYEVGTYEGPFISTRSAYNWTNHKYALSIKYKESDAVGDWYEFWIEDLTSSSNTYAGALRFPFPTDPSKKGITDWGGTWTELYYREVQGAPLPQWSVSILEVTTVSKDGNLLFPKTAHLKNADNFYHVDQVFYPDNDHLDFLIGGSATKSFNEKNITLSTGTININATFNGNPWSGLINFTLKREKLYNFVTTVPLNLSGYYIGTYTILYSSSGPQDATLSSVTPSTMQTLNQQSALNFTFNFVTSSNPLITLIQPNGGETLAAGSTYFIQWTSSNLTSGLIRILFYNGSSWSTVATDLPLTQTSYLWTVPSGLNSDKCKIRVGNYDATTGDWIVYDDSDNNFSITTVSKFFKTTSPLGTETFSPTGTIHVSWEVAGFTGTEGKIRVLFFGDANSPTKWTTVVDNLPIANGSYTIDLSKFNIADPLRCKVRVGVYNPDTGLWLTWTSGTQSGTYIDETGYFSVYSTPPTTSSIHITTNLKGQVFSPTDTITVSWEVAGFTGTEGKIRVLFFGDANSPTKWTTVVDNLPIANGSYTIDLSKFNIADPLRCKVRVGVYNPDTGLWLTWTSGTQSGTYIDETGYFWVISQ